MSCGLIFMNTCWPAIRKSWSADSEALSTKEACGIPSLSQDARTHYCAHAYAHTYAHAQSQACAFHEHANDSCQQNARSIENICGAASTPIRIQEACGIPLQSGCMHALLYARTCTHICTCAGPSLLRLRALFVPFGRECKALCQVLFHLE